MGDADGDVEEQTGDDDIENDHGNDVDNGNYMMRRMLKMRLMVMVMM